MWKILVLCGLALVQADDLVQPTDIHEENNSPLPMNPLGPEARDHCISSCGLFLDTKQVQNYAKVLPCINDCIEGLAMKMRVWLEKPMADSMAAMADTPVEKNIAINNVYKETVNLQNQLHALRRMVEFPASIWDLSSYFPSFPNFGFGFFPPPQPMPQGFSANDPPQRPGIFLQLIQSITKIIDDVIKKQQEILQMVIGCSCNGSSTTTTTTPTPMDTTTTTTTTTTPSPTV